MSPIFVRPVREQLEHDRLIRHLVTKYKRKFEALANIGDEQVAPVKLGTATFFPDLVLSDGKKVAGLVEVESGESVNNLEAMAQWVRFAKARVPFHLYVPMAMYDSARRLCDANQVKVSELWTYRSINDTFDLVRMSTDPVSTPKILGVKPSAPVSSKPAPKPKPAATPKPAPKPAPKPKAKPGKSVTAKAKKKTAASGSRKSGAARRR